MRAISTQRAVSALTASLLAASAANATPLIDDERMILAHEAFVVTFDASTVVITGDQRRARMHLYLPRPDDEGYVDLTAIEEIDCTRGLHRYSQATGVKPGGEKRGISPEKPGLQPIGEDTPASVLRDHLCKLKDLKRGSYGVMLQMPGKEAARAVFALLKVGLDAKPAAQLASQDYADRASLRYRLDEEKVAAAYMPQVIAALGPLVSEEARPAAPIVPLAAAVASGRAGQYLHSEMELGAGLWLKLDGTFQYGLAVGSLDETASGRWTATGDRIALVPDAIRRRSDVDVSGWKVTANGRTLTIVRDGKPMVFERRQGE